jgi:hypothetical protein
MSSNLLGVFIAITSAAVVIQAGILVALFVSVRKSTAGMEALAKEMKNKALPTIDAANSMLTELRPKVDTIVENVSQSTALLRGQMQRLDATVNDVIDRTRLQVIRTDELVNRTLDRVEETSDMVHRTVVSPIRQVSGLVQGVTAGLEFFFRRRRNNRPREGKGVPQDELFI